MKKIVFVLSLVLLLALSSVIVLADETVIISIDSTKVEFNDDLGFPFVDENSRTQVPFRATLEKFGAEVEWNKEDRIAIARKGEIVVQVPINEKYILVNDEKVAVDTAARIVEGRTYLPIRAIIEAFGSDVEWDAQLKTVVITTEPVDAKAIYFAANDKSYEWKNYDVKAKLHMSMDVPDDTGNVQTMPIDMVMDMTVFMNPFKAKVKAFMPMGEEALMPVIEMYMTVDEGAYSQYMGMYGSTGEMQWMKQTVEDEMLAELMKLDPEITQKNKELVEKYTKDVKYFGKYIEDERTLLRLEYTMSGQIFNEIFSEYSDLMPEPATEEEAIAMEALKGLANINIGDITYIAYIDEAGQMVKMEMDLGKLIVSMMSGMTDLLGEFPAEALELLKSMEASMVMEVLNINEAVDFEIPEEALNAQDMTEMLEELQQQQLETGTEVKVNGEAEVEEEL